MDLLTQIDVKLRERLNPYFASFRRRKLKNGSGEESNAFTIISNNCWGGHVYRYFGMPYNSPTVGMYFFAADYIKFLSNLKEYLSKEIIMINVVDSFHYQEILACHQDSLNVPIGRIDDIEIVFLHCHSDEEAYEKWSRRKKRVNFNNLVIKMSEMNGCTPELLKMFDELPFEKKLVFTTRDYGLKSQVLVGEYKGQVEIKNDTAKFRKYVDLIKLINGDFFKKNQ